AGVGSGAEARALLESSARDLGERGRDDTFGHGLLQLADALAARPEPARVAEPVDDDRAGGGSDAGPGDGGRRTDRPVRVPGTVQDVDDACPAAVPRGRFADVDGESVHARAVDCVAWLGLANGV